MKKTLALICTFAMAATLFSGCNKAPAEPSSEPDSTSASEEIINEPLAPEITVADNAIDFVKSLKLGWNVGNTLDAVGSADLSSETSWGQPKVTPELMDYLKEAGFTSVRIPVSWGRHTDGNYTIDPEWMSRVTEDWLIFRNTHEPIISQNDFDIVQEIRRNKRRNQKNGSINLFSGMVYCADCGSPMYLCRSVSLSESQEHMKCSANSKDKDVCSAHYIRTAVLNEIVLNELRRTIDFVRGQEDEFVKAAMQNSLEKQNAEIKQAKRKLTQSEKRIAELDKLFKRLYEDNVLGKISDERFRSLSETYENEQEELKKLVNALWHSV